MPSDSWRRGLWADQPMPVRWQMRALLRELDATHGPLSTRLQREAAKLAVEAWYAATASSGAAVQAASKRASGRGRRPSAQQVDRRMKRAALQAASFDL